VGDASKILKGGRRTILYLLAGALLVLGAAFVGTIVLWPEDEPVKEVATPAAAPAPPPPSDEAPVERRETGGTASQETGREAEEKAGETANKEKASGEEKVVPPDTTMYLTIPKLGLHDVLVLDGTSEAVLSQGAGHVPGTGYPWVGGSNTYLAGHRLGYPGTGSDHVFYDLPALASGDEVILEDSLGQTYQYQVSEVLEVSPFELSVTAPVANRDVVSLQTCIENFGDYWTPGPNWFARYVVRADRVG
jgi:sortase A